MRFNTISFAGFLISVCLLMSSQSNADPQSALAGIQSADPAMVQQSIAELRGKGAAGLTALLQQYDQHPDPKLLPTIDAVAGQHDAVWSRLFWYTDLAEAETAAAAQNKPILYLRLMGKLTDEYSCANSRFFRTVLYSNRQVSSLLRDRFVLVWTSERPVPVVTIDYGDGRKLKRTLTGNSIHYVLDSSGEVIDALPGLFDPVSFARIVSVAGDAARWGPSMRGQYLARADDQILRQWKQDISTVDPQLVLGDNQAKRSDGHPDAARAMLLTASKRAVETPLLRAISPQSAESLDQSIDSVDASTWRKIANLHAPDARLDEQSIAIIRQQNPSAYSNAAALAQTVNQFQQTISEDSLRDNFQMRRKVLSWLRQSPQSIAVEDLNRRVYDELFLTPKSDPWLGLTPQGVYTALTDDGCCAATPQ